jgi:hypothetical protein
MNWLRRTPTDTDDTPTSQIYKGPLKIEVTAPGDTMHVVHNLQPGDTVYLTIDHKH